MMSTVAVESSRSVSETKRDGYGRAMTVTAPVEPSTSIVAPSGIRLVDAATFYAALRADTGFAGSELNVEGAVLLPDPKMDHKVVFDVVVAAENVGGGYVSLEDAFAGWRKSKGHNKNMLMPDITVMGIARADAAGSKYGTYWSLVLARPYVGPQGPTAGPSAGPPGLIFGR